VFEGGCLSCWGSVAETCTTFALFDSTGIAQRQWRFFHPHRHGRPSKAAIHNIRILFIGVIPARRCWKPEGGPQPRMPLGCQLTAPLQRYIDATALGAFLGRGLRLPEPAPDPPKCSSRVLATAVSSPGYYGRRSKRPGEEAEVFRLVDHLRPLIAPRNLVHGLDRLHRDSQWPGYKPGAER